MTEESDDPDEDAVDPFNFTGINDPGKNNNSLNEITKQKASAASKDYGTLLGSNVSAPYLNNYYPKYGIPQQSQPFYGKPAPPPFSITPQQQQWLGSNRATNYLRMQPYSKTLI